MRARCRLAVVLLACTVAACARTSRLAPIAPAQPAPSGLKGLAYTFTLDPTLEVLRARVCMRGASPDRFVYGTSAAMRFLRSPRVVDETPRELAVLETGFASSDVPHDGCMEYDVDFRAAEAADGFYLVRRGDGYLLTAPELFLFRPARRPPGLQVTARFDLPENALVSVPWRKQGDVYQLDETAFSFTGHVAFGRMESQPLMALGAKLDVAVLPGFSEGTRPLIGPWLQAAASVVATVTGKFPSERAQVIVLPTRGPLALRFGHLGRSGGPSLLFFVPEDADLTYFRDDWIAIHELSHLLLPFLRREDAWLSEGMATYLQDVLRARVGLLSREQLWRRFKDGADYGLAATGTLAEETRIMPSAGNYQRVYWAGAVISLLADVELRQRTQGRETLFTALAGIEELRARAVRPMTAEAVLQALDRAVDQAVFTPLAAHWVHAPTFPRVDALYGSLGLGSDGRPLPGGGPLAWIAAAITEGPAAPSELVRFRR